MAALDATHETRSMLDSIDRWENEGGSTGLRRSRPTVAKSTAAELREQPPGNVARRHRPSRRATSSSSTSVETTFGIRARLDSVLPRVHK
jgi:hypothetical protein